MYPLKVPKGLRPPISNSYYIGRRAPRTPIRSSVSVSAPLSILA